MRRERGTVSEGPGYPDDTGPGGAAVVLVLKPIFEADLEPEQCATNYREYTVSVDYVPFDGSLLNLTGYLYRRDDFTLVDQPGDNDWVSRVRLNPQFQF